MAQAGVAYRSARQKPQAKVHPGKRRAAQINRAMLWLTTGIVMVCLFVYVGRMAGISADAKEISQIRREISELEEEQQYLEVLLAARQNLTRVRDEAIGRLGMGYPQEGQVQIVSLSGYSTSVNTQTALDNAMP